MAAVARAIRSDISSCKPAVLRREKGSSPAPIQGVKVGEADNGKIVLQPRLCTLRTYRCDRGEVMRKRRDGGGDHVSPFFETLSESIESSKKSHDFEIMSGRLAMVSTFFVQNLFVGLSMSSVIWHSNFNPSAN